MKGSSARLNRLTRLLEVVAVITSVCKNAQGIDAQTVGGSGRQLGGGL